MFGACCHIHHNIGVEQVARKAALEGVETSRDTVLGKSEEWAPAYLVQLSLI